MLYELFSRLYYQQGNCCFLFYFRNIIPREHLCLLGCIDPTGNEMNCTDSYFPVFVKFVQPYCISAGKCSELNIMPQIKKYNFTRKISMVRMFLIWSSFLSLSAYWMTDWSYIVCYASTRTSEHLYSPQSMIFPHHS